jgi:hypothetical protein
MRQVDMSITSFLWRNNGRGNDRTLDEDTKLKINFISENRFIGKVPRNFNNMRTDLAWISSLDANHYPFFTELSNIERGDIVITILPKKNIDKIFERDLIGYLRSVGDKVLFMQEGPNDFWQDYSLQEQIAYFNILSEFDGILCHNEMDKKYYEGYTNRPVNVMSSLMITDNLEIPEVERSGTMIGGTLCRWYGGIDSLNVAMRIGENISAPSMGRKKPEEDNFDAIDYLPYMNWTQWINELNKRKYAIHLMRTFAAGTFSLNTSYLGIPTIGYNYVDTQRILHPELSVDLGDMQKAVGLAKKLKEDKEFYNHCSNETKRLYNEYYTEKIFLDKFNKIMQEIV